MKKLLAQVERFSGVYLLIGLLAVGGCEEDESPKIEINFEIATASVDENKDIVATVKLASVAKQDEFVTFSVASPVAEYGQDFQIDNVLFLTDKFTIQIPAGATTSTFKFRALTDFEDEPAEIVKFQINAVSNGLSAGDVSSLEITINNVTDFPDENRALSFDGIDDYVDLGNIYDDLEFPITISAWVWLDPSARADEAMPIFNSQDGGTPYTGLNFMTSTSSDIGIQYWDGIGTFSAFRRAMTARLAPIMGRWVNLTAVVKGADDMSVYCNGVHIEGSYSGESIYPMKSNSPSEKAKIGYYTFSEMVYYYKGKLDELRLWNRPLSQEEIQKVIFKKIDGNDTGLIGYWNFDEPTGSVLIDQSTKKFNGTLIGNPTRVLSEVPVK